MSREENFRFDGGNIVRDPETDRYYFVDETYDFNGPYVTRQEAVDALEEYMRLYL